MESIRNSGLSDREKAEQLMLACAKENGYVIEPVWKEQGEFFKN